MSNFQEEMDKRMRRVCGFTDDSLRVSFIERLQDSNWSGSSDDTDFGATYEIDVVVWTHADYPHPQYFRDREATVTFSGLAEMMRALDEVEL